MISYCLWCPAGFVLLHLLFSQLLKFGQINWPIDWLIWRDDCEVIAFYIVVVVQFLMRVYRLCDAVMTWFVCVLVLGLLHSATSSHHNHDDKHSSSSSSTSSSSSVSSPWTERRHRRARDDGACELEIHCAGGGKGDGGQRSSTSGVVRLPIRGQRGPPGAPGAKGEKGQSGTDGHSGSLFLTVIIG